MKGISTEIRVGLLVILALILLGGFIFLLGGFQLGSGKTLYVDFSNAGNVKTGAPVNVAGVKVGSVEEIVYRGAEAPPETGLRPLIRMRLEVQEEYLSTIHEDALFYVTSQSVLGEQIIAIDPGSYERPIVQPDSVVRGVDPPRLDLALALGYELLEMLVDGFRSNREQLQEMLVDVAGILRQLNQLLSNEQESVHNIIENIEVATSEAPPLLRDARTRINSPAISRILSNADRTLGAVSRDINPILADVRQATTKVNTTLDTIGPDERESIRTTIREAQHVAERASVAIDQANEAVGEARGIVAHIQQGRGTIGSLAMDEEIYDDLQELLRDLKHNPWKFFWRE